jgi:hypothetical protein
MVKNPKDIVEVCRGLLWRNVTRQVYVVKSSKSAVNLSMMGVILLVSAFIIFIDKTAFIYFENLILILGT